MKNKKPILLLFILLIFVLIVFLCINDDDKNSINDLRLIVSSESKTERIKLYNTDKAYYAFLPSYVTLCDVEIQVPTGYSVYIDEKEYDGKGFFTEIEYDTNYSLSIKNLFGNTVIQETIVFMKSENIPALSISLTDNSLADINKDKSISASGAISIIESNAQKDFEGIVKEFHSRGQASWFSEKKPYTIELKDNAELLGMRAGKKWVLLANSYDSTNQKNKIVFDTAKELGLKYYCNAEYVDLYIDEEYLGLYLLCERIEVSPTRIDIINLENNTQEINFKKLSSYEKIEYVDNEIEKRAYSIPNNPKDISGGYILKNEMLHRITDDCYFVTPSGWTLDCEQPRHASKEQIAYISSVFHNLEENVDDYEAVSQIIDIDSFVLRYLLQECFANAEGSSFYYIKDSDSVSDKVYAAPVWDFDASMGISDTDSPSGLYANEGLFARLLSHDSFYVQMVNMYSNHLRFSLLGLINNTIPEAKKTIEASARMNKIRWSSIMSSQIENAEACDYLVSFLTERISFLDKIWIDKVRVCKIVFDDPNNVIDYYKSRTVEYGNALGEVETLERTGYQFLGWFDSITGEEYNPNERIIKDHVYYARWEHITDGTNKDESGKKESNILEKLYNIKKSILKNLDFIITVILSCLLMLILVLMVILNQNRGKRHE